MSGDGESAKPGGIITRHAYIRAKQRLGLGRAAIDRMVILALSRGVSRETFAGGFRSYLDEKIALHGVDNLLVYGLHIYVFDETVLITVLEVPREYKRAVAHRTG